MGKLHRFLRKTEMKDVADNDYITYRVTSSMGFQFSVFFSALNRLVFWSKP